MRISLRIKEMSEKMRESDKSNKVFTPNHKSSKDHNYYYESMHKDDLEMQENVMNNIMFTKINNVDNLYYHTSMKAPDAREFQKAVIKKVNAHIR